MAYSTPTTRSTGDLITAAIWNQDVVDNQNAAFPLGVGAWTAYTPSNTNVTVGNGTEIARYTRVGRIVIVSYTLSFGTTTAFTGSIFIGVPVAVADPGGGFAMHHGSAAMYDTGTTIRVGVARPNTGTTGIAVFPDSSLASVNATVPFTWTTSDSLRFTVTYEAAS